MNSAHAVYDRDLAIERAGGSPDLASDLFGMLVNELPTHRLNLLGALSRDSQADLYHHAHKLLGAATYTGVSALRTALEVLEPAAKREQANHAQVQRVIQEIDRVLAFAAVPLQATA